VWRVLVEPELLGPEQLGGWGVQNGFITSGATDAGPVNSDSASSSSPTPLGSPTMSAVTVCAAPAALSIAYTRPLGPGTAMTCAPYLRSNPMKLLTVGAPAKPS
jgi:hypothetical protein